MIYTILETIAASLFLICLGFIAYWIFRWVQGDCEFRVVTRRQSRAVAESLSHTQAVLSFTVPVINEGKQKGILMDVIARACLPAEQYDALQVYAQVTDQRHPRTDGYWKAITVHKGRMVGLRIVVTLKSVTGDVIRNCERIPDVPIDIIYQAMGRGEWYYAKDRVYLTGADIRNALHEYRGGRW